MRPILPQLTHSTGDPIYMQLYRYLKHEIRQGHIAAGERLPSLRRLSQDLDVSLTTTQAAYDQLLVEGYVVSRPQSGYYVVNVGQETGQAPRDADPETDFAAYTFAPSGYRYDLSCFDFTKWKKCMARVLTDYSSLLLFESDPQGEAALRFEISKYVYRSRGVNAGPEQIVIGAGTQQLTTHLCRILRRMQIGHVATEEPGYLPVQNIFRDHGFSITRVPVQADGIRIEKLPVNIRSAVYVSPSNQFPTGSVMPVARRYQLLQWANANDSYILEDDYDSELRYFGKPIPALQGLDNGDRVVYLGSFSSTLFPAVKISYMALPQAMAEIWNAIKGDYTQTCSKTEQLTLALFMEEGFYATNIKKMRKLYAQKLQTALAAFGRCGADFATPINTDSGISIMLQVRTQKAPAVLAQQAREIGLQVQPVRELSTDQDTAVLSFYYNQIPLADMNGCIKQMLRLWRA